MKNKQPIRALLGLNQNDMAMLLGVGRSQYAMFETGKRNLPLESNQLLAEILTYLQSSISLEQKPTFQTVDHSAITSKLELLLRENEYQQILITRKIAALNKKNAKQIKSLQVVEFLKNRPAEKSFLPFVHQLLSNKISRNGANKYTADLAAMEVEQQLVEVQKHFLESKLQEVKLNTSNTFSYRK